MTAPQWFGETIARGWSAELPRGGDDAGLVGRIREQPEDFRVEEIAAYEPSGSGPHLYIALTKRGITTPAAVAAVARAFGIGQGDVGTAGLKDRHAVTTQWFSVNLEVARQDPDAALAELDADPALHVESATRHTNKLKTGHLRGNRFTLVVRDVDRQRLSTGALDAVVARLAAHGMPNYFGSQRFGRDLDNLPRGLAMLSGRERVGGGLRRMLVSAVQSAVFNAVTATRLELGAHERVLDGDVLMRVESGGCFVSDDAARDQARLDAGELVLAGPMPGSQLLTAGGAPGWLEARIAEAIGVGARGRDADLAAHDEVAGAWPRPLWPIEPAGAQVSLRAAGKLARGARRAMMVRPSELGWHVVEAVDAAPQETGSRQVGVELRFSLPSGSYATTLLSEFMGPHTESAAVAGREPSG